MVSAEDVIEIYQRLLENGIRVWVTGGWGIDALLGEQTRSHKDLDVFVLLDDVVRLCKLLESDGFFLKELWSENRQAVDAHGNETATAFVLADTKGREFDVHAILLDHQGNGVPMWDDDKGILIKKQDLAGEGLIAGLPVRCTTLEKQMLSHTGYDPPDYQLRDLGLLQKKFGVKYTDGNPDPQLKGD